MSGGVTRICLWSGPRNVSTAVMYAFAQRADTRVVDEPLYGHYLRVSGANHPGREDVLRAQDTDGNRVIQDVILGSVDRPVLFVKTMAHHLVEVDTEFLGEVVSVLLTRDPREMLPSLINQIADPVVTDTGLPQQVALLRELELRGLGAVVVDSRRLLEDPRAALSAVCDFAGIDFTDAMLSWEPGARPEDGCWAPHWYHNVHRSSGFAPYVPKREPFPEHLEALYNEAAPYYHELLESAHKHS